MQLCHDPHHALFAQVLSISLRNVMVQESDGEEGRQIDSPAIEDDEPWGEGP